MLTSAKIMSTFLTNEQAAVTMTAMAAFLHSYFWVRRFLRCEATSSGTACHMCVIAMTLAVIWMMV
ncbi:hypothetical protein BDU57DRAFT_513018 [Ampelomyces quisqualis]|uniref:Uncharacterized protein n=1 Tax=Ampelomyces quisqualis TaxID=50730 RepID=A0A6A5QWC1_AMPQU|nr:hypothetical protein BDU57DRAFT_513018 [Ampelomyces quisqualis]